jgi:hypothetical protein
LDAEAGVTAPATARDAAASTATIRIVFFKVFPPEGPMGFPWITL